MKLIRFIIKRWKGLAATFFLLGTFGVIGMFLMAHIAARSIDKTSNGKVFYRPENIPHQTVGLVLGCSRLFSNGNTNRYFLYRMEAAEQLFASGKVDYLLVSGDNSRINYDECTDMKTDLISRGIPEDHIFCDYAGFRTLDSIVRANKVFQQRAFTVISQEFHVRRAIYLASNHGLTVQGFCARDVRGRTSIRTKVREVFAKIAAFVDVHPLHTQPKFLGPAIPIPLPETEHQL